MKTDEKVTTLDIDRKSFSKLIVVSQTRDFDLKNLNTSCQMFYLHCSVLMDP